MCGLLGPCSPSGRFCVPGAMPSGRRGECHLAVERSGNGLGTPTLPDQDDRKIGLGRRGECPCGRLRTAGPLHPSNWHSPPVSIGRSARTGDRASQTRARQAWQARAHDTPSPLYKCRGVPVKSPICAICLDRTRGVTRLRELTHGVRVSLCEGHNSIEFMRSNGGRDFVVTLLRTWGAQGCLTRSRSRALELHLGAVRAAATRLSRARPGSYAWPRLRREAEDHFARGDGVSRPSIACASASRDHAKVPSVRTMRRWFSQGRWLRPPPRHPVRRLRRRRATCDRRPSGGSRRRRCRAPRGRAPGSLRRRPRALPGGAGHPRGRCGPDRR